MAYGDGPADEKLRNAWHRFCDLMSQNPASFRTRLAKRSELPDALPSDTAMVSEGGRVKQVLDCVTA